MALFESYERRIDQINAVLNSYGISSIEEAEKITKDAGLDVYNMVKGIQPICFENACWAYIVGAAIAIKKGARKASEAAAAIGEGLQAFCIPGSVADQRKVGTRPDFLEAEAVSRLLRIAQAADAPVVIVHLTNREALLEVDHARKRGQTVYVETCPQYLLLDESVYFNEDYSAAARYVCAPPLRDKAEQEHLWKGLRRGAIQTVSTDHCSFTLAQKDMGREDFTKIPGGLPGVETRGELLYSYGVAKRKISAAQMCRVLSENPARLYGLYPRKGVLRPGSDADIVVYDLDKPHLQPVYEALPNLFYAAGASDICLNMIDGEVVYRDGVLTRIDEEKVKAEARSRSARILSEL